jgi:hypothetical protein
MDDPSFSLSAWMVSQRNEQGALRFLANTPYLGDSTGVARVQWDDPDPTWWSDLHGAQLVGREEMLAALDRHGWLPRGLSPAEVDALKRVLSRPAKPPPGSAKVARKPPRRSRGLDPPGQRPTVAPPRKQPRLPFAAK